jgi:hypothetical protein
MLRLANLAVDGLRREHGETPPPAIEHGQRAGQAEAGRADVRVGLAAVLVDAAAEGLGLGQELDVDFKADDGLVLGETMNPSDLLGAALFFELRVFGVGTGAFSTDDWEGLRTVIAPAAMRGELAARAVHALIQRGAHVVLTTYRHTSPEEKAASRMLQRRGVLWTEYDRKVTKHRLMLEKTYDETLAKFGKQTRFNFRYYRKRLMARMDCRFLPDALPEVDETELVLMNAKALNPVSEDECRRRFRAARDLADGFLIALRGPQGQLLSILGGWRQGTTTVMHHQSQIAGFEKDSLCTVMRAFFLESEIERGTRTVIFYHGTNHRMTHAFDVEPLRDLVVCRKSLRARLLRKLATRVASPRYYRDTHYFGGSTTFFASTLTHEDAIWRSGPQEWRDPVDVAPEAESEFVKRAWFFPSSASSSRTWSTPKPLSVYAAI